MWFRMEPGREEHIRGAVWVGKVNSQVRWEDRAGPSQAVSLEKPVELMSRCFLSA